MVLHLACHLIRLGSLATLIVTEKLALPLVYSSHAIECFITFDRTDTMNLTSGLPFRAFLYCIAIDPISSSSFITARPCYMFCQTIIIAVDQPTQKCDEILRMAISSKGRPA